MKQRATYRTLPDVEIAKGNTLKKFRGKNLINLSSNDYLGLSFHPKVVKAMAKAAEEFGCGARGSRLVCGTTPLHRKFEEELCEFIGYPKCILFGSGYHANTGVIPAIAGKNSLIISDKLNHASIIDGCKLSEAKIVVAQHANPKNIKTLAKKLKRENTTSLIVTETTFSMDGDEPDVNELAVVALETNSTLYLDEAHSIGIKGENGSGLSSLIKKGKKSVIVMATLGKAFGCYGAFVCCDEILFKLIVNRARTLIYSTSLPPPVISAALKALQIIKSNEGSYLREKLLKNSKEILSAAIESGWNVRTGCSYIIPLIIGDTKKVIQIERKFIENGIYIKAMRYPTVPEGEERLRISVSAALTEKQIDKIKITLMKIGKTLSKS